jgi:hypothetical protein
MLPRHPLFPTAVLLFDISTCGHDSVGWRYRPKQPLHRLDDDPSKAYGPYCGLVEPYSQVTRLGVRPEKTSFPFVFTNINLSVGATYGLLAMKAHPVETSRVNWGATASRIKPIRCHFWHLARRSILSILIPLSIFQPPNLCLSIWQVAYWLHSYSTFHPSD